jgi:hypothetical protein
MSQENKDNNENATDNQRPQIHFTLNNNQSMIE